MRVLLCGGVLLVGLAGFANADMLDYELGSGSSVDANQDSGLIINTELDAALADVAFTLDDGDSFTFDFFDIWTPESTLNGDDFVPQAITATLDFDVPDEVVIIDGASGGGLTFFGIVQFGYVVWDNPVTVMTSRGDFEVSLSNEAFNGGAFGLNEGQGHGATVFATVTQVDSVPIPAPGAVVLAMLGFGGVASMRRRTND